MENGASDVSHVMNNAWHMWNIISQGEIQVMRSYGDFLKFRELLSRRRVRGCDGRKAGGYEQDL